jgi:hypothetical protein
VARNVSVYRVVALHVRVEQVERHAPNVNAPSLHAHNSAAHLKLDVYRLAVRAAHQM